MKKILNKNIVIIGLTFFVPGIIAFLCKNSFSIYKLLVRPKIAPPAIVFPIAWNILYLLMSIAYILVKNLDESNMKIYYFQLIINALWTPIFFVFKWYLFAALELVFLLIIVIYMTYKFYIDDKKTLYLLLPYMLWVTFALYLNLYISIHN